MKKVLIGAGVVLLLAIMVFASLRAGGDESGEEVYVTPAQVDEIVEIVKASGRIDARVKVDLSAHVVARIEHLFVEEGDEVTQGQPFLELEKDQFVAARDSWRAQLAQARQDVAQAEIEREDALLKLERSERLHGEGVVSQEDLEAARLRVRRAELSVERAREAVAQAQANLDNAETDLGRTTIYSPLTGRVTELNAEAGEVVVSGTMNNPASKIATVADLSEILAELDVDENEIVQVEMGQVVDLVVDAVEDHTFTGRVVEVGSSGYSLSRQPDVTFFRVKVLLDDPGMALRPGMSTRAEIRVASDPEALVVPIQAVVERRPLLEGNEAGTGRPEAGEELQRVVFVVEDGIARQRPVEVGLTEITRAQITGVEAGTGVVTGPYRTLRDLEDGDPIHVVEEGDVDDIDTDDEDDGDEETD